MYKSLDAGMSVTRSRLPMDSDSYINLAVTETSQNNEPPLSELSSSVLFLF